MVLIFSSALSLEDQKKIVSKVEKYISEAKGKLLSCEEWGKKPLSYPIKKQTEGFYWFLRIELNPDAGAKLNNNLRLEDQTIRFMLIKTDEKQSVPVQKEVTPVVENPVLKPVETVKKEVKKPLIKSKKAVK